MENKKLTRSADRIIGGVCGGIGEFFGINPTLIRVGYAALSVFTAGFPGFFLYLILWVIVPSWDKNI